MLPERAHRHLVVLLRQRAHTEAQRRALKCAFGHPDSISLVFTKCCAFREAFREEAPGAGGIGPILNSSLRTSFLCQCGGSPRVLSTR